MRGFRRLALGLEVAVLGAGGGQRGLLEPDAEELAALRRRPERVLTCRLVVARAASAPGGQIAGGGKHAHVGAGLSDQHLGDAADRCRQLHAGLSGRDHQLGLDRFRELGDVVIQEVQMREDRAVDQRVVGFKARQPSVACQRTLVA